jgi:hypothetical protein
MNISSPALKVAAWSAEDHEPFQGFPAHRSHMAGRSPIAAVGQ